MTNEMRVETKPTVKTKAVVQTRSTMNATSETQTASCLNGVPGMNAVPELGSGYPAMGRRATARAGYLSSLAAEADGVAESVGQVEFAGALSQVMAPRLAKNEDDSGDGDTGTVVVTKTKPKTKRPNMYRVLLLNDDYTPMEFVVHVLERFFQKNLEDATRIMLHVHHHGVGECGVFTYEVAETKVTQVMDFARKHQHPLQCVMEKK